MTPIGHAVTLVPNCGESVGLGHLSRAVALAEELGRSSVLSLPDSPQVHAYISKRNVDYVVDDSSMADRAVAAAMRSDIVVVDGYGIAASAIGRMRETSKVVLIDDLDADLPSDLTVNPSLASAGRPHAADRYLGPPSHHILTRACRAAREARKQPGTSILISTGGTEANHLGTRVAECLGRLIPDRSINVVVQATIAASSGDVHAVVSPNTLIPLLEEAVIYVGGAGVTAVEAACIGVPSVVCALAENQTPQAGALDVGNCAIVTLPDPDALATAAAALVANPVALERLARNGRSLIDGRGTSRVATAILELLQ